MPHRLRWWWLLGTIGTLLVLGGFLVHRQHQLRERARLTALQLTLDAAGLRSKAEGYRIEAALPMDAINYHALRWAERSDAEAEALEARAQNLHLRIAGLDWLTLRADEIPEVDTTEAESVVPYSSLPLPASGTP